MVGRCFYNQNKIIAKNNAEIIFCCLFVAKTVKRGSIITITTFKQAVPNVIIRYQWHNPNCQTWVISRNNNQFQKQSFSPFQTPQLPVKNARWDRFLHMMSLRVCIACSYTAGLSGLKWYISILTGTFYPSFLHL